jgi:hypothetical protein
VLDYGHMSKVEHIEEQIQSLSEKELAEFRVWFIEFDHLLWDRQIEADSKSGKLDKLAAQALADYKAGKARGV